MEEYSTYIEYILGDEKIAAYVQSKFTNNRNNNTTHEFIYTI